MVLLHIKSLFSCCTLTSDLSGLSLVARKHRSHAALKQTLTSKTIWPCVQPWPHTLPSLPLFLCFPPHLWWVILNPNRLLSHRPHHTVARLQSPGTHRGLGARCSISNGARGGWSRQGWGRVGVWVGIGVEFDWAGPSGMSHHRTPPPPPLPPSRFPITKPHSALAPLL